MAHRLATKFRNVSFELNEQEISQIYRLFMQKGCVVKEQREQSGDRKVEVVRQKIKIILSIKKIEKKFRCTVSCEISDQELAEVIGRLIRDFQGEGTAYRIYHNFQVVYRYEEGEVQSITNRTANEEKTIYEHKSFTKEIKNFLKNDTIEKEIEKVKKEIDILLDLRNKFVDDKKEIKKIDSTLSTLSKELFKLEA